MTLASILILLQTVISLLVSIQQSPAVPETVKQQAISLANQAVKMAAESASSPASIGFSSDQLLDTLWKRTFHWLTFFESTAGFTTSGNVSADGNQLVLTTTNGGAASILKQVFWQGLATFSSKSFFRTAFIADPDTTAYIVVGRAESPDDGQYYGFKLVNDSLYGVASSNGTAKESTVFLGTITLGRVNNIEARYYPNDRVEFLVNPTRSSQAPKGTLRTNLPSPAETPNPHLMNISISSPEATVKSIRLSFFEYLQERNVLQ